jgi:toxin YoeB
VSASKARGKGGTERAARAEEATPRKRACVIDPNCLEDLQWWVETDARVARKALDLMKYALRDPFDGPGKPEPLKGLLPNTWSRRLTGEHRLVYVVFNERVVFLQARYHY